MTFRYPCHQASGGRVRGTRVRRRGGGHHAVETGAIVEKIIEEYFWIPDHLTCNLLGFGTNDSRVLLSDDLMLLELPPPSRLKANVITDGI